MKKNQNVEIIINGYAFKFNDHGLDLKIMISDQNHIFSKGLLYLLSGFGLKNIDEISENYLQIYSQKTSIAKFSSKFVYFKKIKEKFNTNLKFRKSFENPITQFIELSKLLSAIKAGHIAVKDDVINVLDEIIELGYFNEKKKIKILKKIFLEHISK